MPPRGMEVPLGKDGQPDYGRFSNKDWPDEEKGFARYIEFIDNYMVAQETAVEPELPPGEAVSWVRIPFARKWFAEIDNVEMTFHLKAADGRDGVARHSVPIVTHRQQAELRLPFRDVWVADYGAFDLSGEVGVTSVAEQETSLLRMLAHKGCAHAAELVPAGG